MSATVITTFTKISLQHQGDVVSVQLHCEDELKAAVLYDDLVDRARTQKITVRFGPCEVQE